MIFIIYICFIKEKIKVRFIRIINYYLVVGWYIFMKICVYNLRFDFVVLCIILNFV